MFAHRLKRVPAIATWLFSMEMLMILLLLITASVFVSQITAEQSTINTAITAGLEQAAVTPTTQNGAYYNVGWNGQGVTLESSALPAILSATFDHTIPGSTTTTTAQSVTWTLPAAANVVWHLGGPIQISQLQTTSAPNQPVTLGTQTVTYPYPVIAGRVAVPLNLVTFFHWRWTVTMSESFVLPLAGRANPHTIVSFHS
ncbi:hypothetical protein [Sulfobacillus thermosulfidooxidans]|uniref:hypothetical protein n=1 Tax=Sulfobacillus thermosulfidooxidans TaxID=28034 RepID=UPI0006B3FB08|nr:hypothetical protein [Sulfobacillus thermosulfidooxidans]